MYETSLTSSSRALSAIEWIEHLKCGGNGKTMLCAVLQSKWCWCGGMLLDGSCIVTNQLWCYLTFGCVIWQKRWMLCLVFKEYNDIAKWQFDHKKKTCKRRYNVLVSVPKKRAHHLVWICLLKFDRY